MAKEYNEKGENFKYSITELSGEGCTHIYSNSEEAARWLLNSNDEKNIKMIDIAINQLLETGEEQFVWMDVDYNLGNNKSLRGRCKVMIALD